MSFEIHPLCSILMIWTKSVSMNRRHLFTRSIISFFFLFFSVWYGGFIWGVQQPAWRLSLFFLNDSSGTIGEGYISTSITLYTKRTVFVAVVTFFGGLMKLISRFLKYIYECVCVCSRQAFVYMYVGIYWERIRRQRRESFVVHINKLSESWNETTFNTVNDLKTI